MQTYRLIFLVGMLGIALTTSACDPTTPSEVNTTKIRVKDQMITETLNADHIDLSRVPAIAHHILLNGNNADVTLTVPYLPGGYAKAMKLGNAYKRAFAAQGVNNFSVAPVQMADRNDTGKAVLSYQGLVASQPEDCRRLPGYQGSGTLEDVEGYPYGCELQANVSKMIADPADLLGKEPTTEGDSRRNGTIIENYEAGKPNTTAGAMSASGGK